MKKPQSIVWIFDGKPWKAPVKVYFNIQKKVEFWPFLSFFSLNLRSFHDIFLFFSNKVLKFKKMIGKEKKNLNESLRQNLV